MENKIIGDFAQAFLSKIQLMRTPQLLEPLQMLTLFFEKKKEQEWNCVKPEW